MNTFSRTLRTALRAPLQAESARLLLSGLGGGLCIMLLTMLGDWQHYALLMAPFGATMVILFALPDSPLAQPRNIVGGHLLTTLVGFAVLALMTVNPLSLGLAVGAGIVLMQLSGTTHPPAGANPLLVMTTLPTLDFVLTPVLAGTLLIVAFGVVYHRSVGRVYPQRWW